MTMPNEELRALKQTHEFMRWLLSVKKVDLVNMPINDLRKQVYYCIKHYPFDCVLDKIWEERMHG